jgi:hypothetical protein
MLCTIDASLGTSTWKGSQAQRSWRSLACFHSLLGTHDDIRIKNHLRWSVQEKNHLTLLDTDFTSWFDDQHAIHSTIYPSVHYLLIYPCIHSSVHSCIHLFIHSLFHPSTQPFTPIYSFFHTCIYTSIHASFHLSIYSSNHPSIHSSNFALHLTTC